MKSLSADQKKPESPGGMLRYWRQLSKISQMDLALEIDISAKHLSFVETGRSKPSRDLVLKITDSLKLPFRHRNTILLSAGYAPEFKEEPFTGPGMRVVREAMLRLLESHDPYPAFVVDTGYKILMKNAGYDQFVRFFAGETALNKYDNAIRMLFAQDGLRPYVKGWPALARFLVARLADEVISTQNSELVSLYKEISLLRFDDESVDSRMDITLPVMSLVLEKGSKQARFFTTIATLGTPLDLTTQELRLELLFPSDDKTKGLFPLENG